LARVLDEFYSPEVKTDMKDIISLDPTSWHEEHFCPTCGFFLCVYAYRRVKKECCGCSTTTGECIPCSYCLGYIENEGWKYARIAREVSDMVNQKIKEDFDRWRFQ
jgi:hypothetical protein